MICTFIDWVRGQHALCQTRELNIWLDRVIGIMHPVDYCFVISPCMKIFCG